MVNRDGMLIGILALLVLLIAVGGVLSFLLWKHLKVFEARRRGDVARGVEMTRVSDQHQITDAAKVLAALVVMTDSVESMREQNSAEHAPIRHTGADTNMMVRRILSRLGFLVSTDPMLPKDQAVDASRMGPVAPPPPPKAA